MSTPFSTTNLRPTRFPPEIYEIIIDSVGHGEYDGRAEYLHWCSLVCSSWEYRTRPHILRVVRLGNLDHVLDLLDTLLQKPHYGSFIRTLKLRGPRRDHLSSSEQKVLDIVTTGWLSRAIIALPTLLHNLDRLELHRLPGSDMIQISFPRYFGNFKNIRSLSLGHLTEQTFYVIVRIINEFPDLQSVEIADCTWAQLGRPTPSQKHRLSELSLDLRPEFEQTMSEWMFTSDSLSALRSLTWWSYKESSSRVSGILSGCANTLREATMTICDPENHLPQVPRLDRHTSLNSFTLDVRQTLTNVILHFFGQVIVELPSSITTVRLTCDENLNDLFLPDNRFHWEFLEHACRRSVLGDIKRVEIYTRCPHLVDYTQVDEVLRRALDRLLIRRAVWCVNRPSESSGLLYHQVEPDIEQQQAFLAMFDETVEVAP